MLKEDVKTWLLVTSRMNSNCVYKFNEFCCTISLEGIPASITSLQGDTLARLLRKRFILWEWRMILGEEVRGRMPKPGF